MFIAGKEYPEYSFNLQNARDMDKIQTALTKLKQSAFPDDGVVELSEGANIIRQECQKVKAFFDAIFGEGEFMKVVSDVDDYGECASIADDIVDEIAKQGIKTQLTLQNRANRYSPNRAARRSKK